MCVLVLVELLVHVRPAVKRMDLSLSLSLVQIGDSNLHFFAYFSLSWNFWRERSRQTFIVLLLYWLRNSRPLCSSPQFSPLRQCRYLSSFKHLRSVAYIQKQMHTRQFLCMSSRVIRWVRSRAFALQCVCVAQWPYRVVVYLSPTKGRARFLKRIDVKSVCSRLLSGRHREQCALIRLKVDWRIRTVCL